MAKVYDSVHDVALCERLSDNMYLDNNGQLICENAVLARTGSYDYLESELKDGGDPNKVVQVLRTPEEVFDPVSIKSMNYKPFVDEHPEENITPDTVGELQKGFMTNARRGTGEFSECLIADLVVTDPYVIDEIRSGRKRELSVGYTADIEEIDGKYYMKNIRGNHIALCEAGRAGNARIRDSKTVKDKTLSWDELKKYYTGKKTSHGSDIFLIEGKYCTNPNTSNERYNSIAELERGEAEHFRRMAGYKDEDIAAKGSFNSLDELINFYRGATTEANDNGVVVCLPSGAKLLYSFLDGTSGKLLFVRKVADSVGVKVVDVLGGGSLKFKEGQRVNYFGTECKVTRIYPSGGKFFIELGLDGNVVARFTYETAEENYKAGTLKLRDSVVFDSKSGKFGFEDVKFDDPAHEKELDRTHFIDDELYKRGDKVKPREGGPLEEIVDIITESTGSAGLGKTVKKYVMKSGRKYVAEDLEGAAWVRVNDSVSNKDLATYANLCLQAKTDTDLQKLVDEVESQDRALYLKLSERIKNDYYSFENRKNALANVFVLAMKNPRDKRDSGEVVKRFRVVTDGRTFETKADSAAHAAQKVAWVLRDADDLVGLYKNRDDEALRVKLNGGFYEVSFGTDYIFKDWVHTAPAMSGRNLRNIIRKGGYFKVEKLNYLEV